MDEALERRKDRIAVIAAAAIGAIIERHGGISDRDILTQTQVAHEAEYQIEQAVAQPAPFKTAA
jgi:hypothetical protein